jgi:alpha-ketoglutarate-dependent taurine dioxygenase
MTVAHCLSVLTLPVSTAWTALLDELKEFATQPQFTYRHQWQSGDMVMFDNICVMHRAMPYDLSGSRRLLHRTTVAGEAHLQAVQSA